MKEARICKCGTVHFLDQEVIESAIKADENVLLICGGCGRATYIGADIQTDMGDPSKTVYMMYSSDVGDSDFSLTKNNFLISENHKPIHSVLYSKGKRVMMMSGMHATQYYAGQFFDNWYPDLYKIDRGNVTASEVMEFISAWSRDRKTVNMRELLTELTDEEADVLSKYLIKGLDWKGTKYQRSFDL